MPKSLSIFVFCALMVSACTTRPPGIGGPVEWSSLQNWASDNQSDVWEGFLKSCQKLSHQQWQEVCHLARNSGDLSDSEVREFFESNFDVRPVYAEDGVTEGLITGYYEPLLEGSWERSEEFRYPLYGVPKDLLIVDLDDQDLLQGTEILWVNSLVDVFFLHVQGSGRVQLMDGSTTAVGYAGQNGHPYQSIGKVLTEMGELNIEEVTLFTIKDWLKSNPTRLNEVLSKNPSYIFFELRNAQADGPIGSLNVALTPRRSIAVDRNVIPLGAPVWLQTTLPNEKQSPLNKLMLAQDTGGAIKGHVRADVFWGRGDEAEKMAGLMKQRGKLFVLLPKGYSIEKNQTH